MDTSVNLPPPPYPVNGVQSSIPRPTCVVQNEEAYSNSSNSQSVISQNVPKLVNQENDSSGMDHEKKLVYKHPLFPLMAMLFEKCEQATQTADWPTSRSCDMDINDFVTHQEQDHKPFLVNNPEIDELMLKTIQVLRIHVMELEKVNELCQDFCQRYITCLKGKLHNEQLLHVEGAENFEDNISLNDSSEMCHVSAPKASAINQNQIVSGNTVYQMVQTPQGLVAQPLIGVAIPAPTVIASSVSPPGDPSHTSHLGSLKPIRPAPPQTSPVMEENDEDKKAAKRGILPKQATQIMKSWLFQHIVHPYPTEDEKRLLASQTHLSILQINNWFINARRRILQPMLDGSNPDSAKQKKFKPPQNRPQKYWSEKLAEIQQHTRSTSESEDESIPQTGEQLEVNDVSMADLLRGMSHIVNTSNADVTSIMNNVQQATSLLVVQNENFSPTKTIDCTQQCVENS